MREIKFRVWDRDNKYMIESDQSVATIIHRNLCSGSWSWFSNCDLSTPDNYKERYIVMQYTWLKDKNWKEIYEGDIIKYKTNKIQFSLVQWISDWFKVVKKISPTSTRTSTLWNFIAEYQCEIIWNIYENPDLLTNK